MISGESWPLEKTIGDTVIGATINKTGSFEFTATKIGANTVLAQIVQLIEEAQGSKAPIQNLADKISAIFVPIVIILATITFISWYFILGANLNFALMAFTSVIVIACPCALSLATPTALMVGTGQGAKNGILIKGGEPLQIASRVNTIVFDKTATLTLGQPKVTAVIPFSNMTADLIATLAASLEKSSEHPLAAAVISYATEKKLTLFETQDFKAITGHGLEGKINGQKYFLGNRRLISTIINLKTANAQAINKLEEQGQTVIVLANGRQLLGAIAMADIIRTDAHKTVTQLIKKNWQVYLVTGDNLKTAQAIAQQAGIDPKNVLAEALPEDKIKEIKKLQAKGRIVAMVGDGINDAPALAQADLGIAMGGGTDVAIETGGIVIIKNDLMNVMAALDLSRTTMAKIKQNLFFSLFYNTIGIPIAARVFVSFGLILKPELAGLAMALSSISVVTNSLFLKSFRPNHHNYWSIIAPIIMAVAFSLIFFEFINLSTQLDLVSRLK